MLPVIDLSLFDLGNPWRDHVAAQVDWAAGEHGLFHVVGHGVEPGIADSLLELSSAFYRQAPGSIHPSTGPSTNGTHLYFGEGLAEDHSRGDGARLVRNDYPSLPGFRESVLDYMSALTGLAHRLMTSFGRGLRLGDNYFVDRYTADPATRLRIVRYPGIAPSGLPELRDSSAQTDTSLLTLIHQQEMGGLQVKSGSTWVDVPYVPGSFIIAVGDSMERLTSGRYAAAIRRVLNRSSRAGVALQFSFHPRSGTSLQAIPLLGSVSAQRARMGLAGDKAVTVPAVMTRGENVSSQTRALVAQ